MNEHEPAEKDFEKLRKLLALKRHEQPPPGYFDRLPGRIMARIEALEAEKKHPWWERWFARPLSHPAVGWAYASLAVALVVGGIAVGQRVKSSNQANVPSSSPSALPASSQPMLAAETNGTASPPGFLTQPGTLIQTQNQKLEIERAGFKQ